MFSKRLRNLRDKKYTQQDLANFLGITRQAYGKYEAGNAEPDINTLNKLAEFFDVTTDYLTGRTDKPNLEVEDNPVSIAFSHGGKNLSEDEKEHLEAELKRYREIKARFMKEKNKDN